MGDHYWPNRDEGKKRYPARRCQGCGCRWFYCICESDPEEGEMNARPERPTPDDTGGPDD